MLDIETTGSSDALGAFSDLSDDAKPGQSITMVDVGTLTVNTGGGNAISAQSLSPNTYKVIVDQPAFANIYVESIDSLVGVNGNMVSEVGKAALRRIREYVAGDIIDQARDILVGAADVGRVVNAGAATLTDAHVHAAISGARKAAGAIGQEISVVGSPGFAAAAKGLVNYRPPMAGAVGVEAVSYVDGAKFFETNALESSAGDRSVATSASTISSNVGTQTVAAGHGFIRGMLVTTAGLTANATTATAVTLTASTSVACAITAGDGAQVDGVGTVSSASSLGLVVVKPWVGFAIAQPEVHIVKSPTRAGWLVQVSAYYGVKVRPGGLVAVHAPAI